MIKSMDHNNLILIEQQFRTNGLDFNRDARKRNRKRHKHEINNEKKGKWIKKSENIRAIWI